MAERNSVYVFKGPTTEQFRDAAHAVVEGLGGKLDWDARPEPINARLLTSHNGNVHAAYIHCEGYKVAMGIGSTLETPWINVRIQEGTLWDYSLYRADLHLDSFSTMPEYWEEDDEDWLATQRGNPKLLAECWQLDTAYFENYLKPWGYEVDEDEGVINTSLRGKAYPRDNFEYGDIWQMTDFLRALGAHDPNFDQPNCIPRGLELDKRARR